MQAGGSQQHQPPRPGVQLLHPHPRQTRQVQVNGAGADPAPAGQHGLRPAKPCQQRRAEENGSPHLCRCLPRQGALDRAAGERHIAALPLGRAACAPQQRKAALYVREPWHAPQRTGRWQSSAAARSGSTLFFAAGTRTVPFKGHPPVTTICSALCAISAAPIPQKIPQAMQRERGMSIRLISQEFGASFVPVYLR